MKSQLLYDDAFYRRQVSSRLTGPSGSSFSGVTRIIIGMVDIAKVMPLSDLIQASAMTLLFQTGIDENGDDQQAETPVTLEPLLLEVKVSCVAYIFYEHIFNFLCINNV